MKKLHLWAFLGLSLLYTGLSIGLPADPKVLQQYHISQNQFRFVDLTLVIPLLIIYWVGFYAYSRVQSYATTVADTKEGPGFNKLADGLGVLAFSLPVSASIGALLNYLAITNMELLPRVTMIRNYIGLAFSVITFLLIARGANLLLNTLKQKLPHPPTAYAVLGAIILSSLFTWAITTHQHAATGEATYYLPNWLVLFTLAIPYLYAWCRGLTATYHLLVYQRFVKGRVYKHAIKYLARGFGGVVVLSILIQLIATLSVRLSKLDLTPLLLLVYVLVAFYAIAFGIVARGARLLKQIEEV